MTNTLGYREGTVVPSRTHLHGPACYHRRTSPPSARGYGGNGPMFSHKGSVVAQTMVFLVATRKMAALNWVITEPCMGRRAGGKLPTHLRGGTRR